MCWLSQLFGSGSSETKDFVIHLCIYLFVSFFVLRRECSQVENCLQECELL